MKTIVLCPFSYQKNLLSLLRKSDPFADVKFIDKETILRAYYGSFKTGSTLAMMKKYNLSYSMAKIYLKFMPYVCEKIVDDEKVENILKIKKYLINKDYFVKDDSILSDLSGLEVQICGYSLKDQQLLNIFDKFNIKYKKLDISSYKNEASVSYSVFNTAEEEVHNVMINIINLIKNGTNINDIFVYGIDGDYEGLFKRYAKLYQIPVNGFTKPLLSQYSFGKFFIKNYTISKDFKNSVAKCDEIYGKNPDYLIYKQALLENYDKDLTYEQQKDIFTTNIKVSKACPIYDNAITILDDLVFLNGKTIFVLGFSQGKFPLVKTDNEYLNDALKAQFNLLTSKQENIVKKDEMLQFLQSFNNFNISFAYKVGLNLKYESFLKDDLKLKGEAKGIPHIDYSSEAAKYELVKMHDLGVKYREYKPEFVSYSSVLKQDFNTYDNQYDFVDCVDENKVMYHSYSSLNKFITCPFSYYLSNILGLDDFEDNFSAKFGTAAHAVLQRCLKDYSLNFDDVFEQEIGKQDFLVKEVSFARNLKKQIECALKACKNHLDSLKDPKVLFEQKVVVPLNKSAYLLGYMDKVIVTENKWLSIIDYKTGKYSAFSKHSVELGFGLQLPAYGLLAKKDPELSKYHLGGLYIQEIVHDDFDNAEENPEDPKLLKLKGKPIQDVDYIHSIDPSYFSGNCKFINVKPNKDLNSIPKRSSMPEADLIDCIKESKSHFLRVDKEIRNCNFVIKPYRKGQDTGCKYCPFKDVCYVKIDQFREVPTERAKKDGDTLE